MARRQQPSVNRHHLFWERRTYRKQPEHQFRNHPGLVVTMDAATHKELHHDLFPPHKPTRQQMADVVDLLRQVPHHQRETDTLWGLLVTRAYFLTQAYSHPNREVADRAAAIGDHLTQQLGYIALSLPQDHHEHSQSSLPAV